jgi:hypothetical protein
MKQDFDKTIRIPVITDLVRAGNPDIVGQAKSQQAKQQRRDNFEKRLKERIAELQSATGQDEYSGIARAHAIRSENSKHTTPVPMGMASEKQMDQARDELIKELASFLKP